MTLSLMTADTGFGIGSDIGVYRWNAHAFNPSAEDPSQTWNPFTESYTGFYIFNVTSAFNLAGFQYGNEAMLAAIQVESNVNDSGTIYMDWYDPDANLLFSFSYAFSVTAGNWVATWSGIGIKADGDEIWKNGTYHIAWSAVGVNTISGDLYPVVSNYPTTTQGTDGYIWVEGDNLAFCCSQGGYKIVCQHDGTSSFKGVAYAGYIWLETDGKISYIDSSGYKRSTKMGDKYGWYPDPTELPGSGLDEGYIWVSTGFYTDTFLCIVSDDGVKYRVGAGYVHAGDYQ